MDRDELWCFGGGIDCRSADRGQAVTPNKTLERTVVNRGRIVRAVALYAQADAEVWSWPAVQRNR